MPISPPRAARFLGFAMVTGVGLLPRHIVELTMDFDPEVDLLAYWKAG